MTGRSITVMKEARAIFWPWCAVAFTGLISLLPLPWLDGQLVRLIYTFGFLVGIPLLASLSIGNEFQGRTLSLWLSQPISRVNLWWTKFGVVLAASLAAALVYSFGHLTFQRLSDFAAAWLIVAVCSGPFWTLVAKSTIGGLVLNMFQVVIIDAAGTIAEWRLGAADTRTALAVSVIVALAYGATMLWLGWRKFERLEVTGTVSGNDLPILNLNVLRARPAGAVLDLIRKEVRLLWPLWFLTICFLVVLACLAPFQSTAGASASASLRIQSVAVAIVVLYGLAALVLSGSLSMGEERVLRTQSWHMTLPMSADLQWAIKMIVAVVAGASCVWLVVLEAQWLFGQAFTDLLSPGLISPSLTDRLLLLTSLSLLGFWCACGVNGTVRAALWAVPAVCAYAIAHRLALELPYALSYTAAMAFIVRRFHTLSFHYDVYMFLITRARGLAMPLMLVLPSLLYALFQSRRAFRMEVRDNVFSTIRYLAKPPLFTLLFLFPIVLFHAFAMKSWWEATSVIQATHSNIRALQLDLSSTDESHPRHLTHEEMTSVIKSDAARAWLQSATIEVFAGPTQNIFRGVENVPYVRDLMSISVRLDNGSECKASGYFNTRTGRLGPAFVRCNPM